MQRFRYTDGQYRMTVYGCLLLFLVIALFILGMFTGHVARPKTVPEAIPLAFIQIFPLIAFYMIWRPARPIETSEAGISALMLGSRLNTFKWSELTEIDLIRYKDRRTGKMREILIILSGNRRIAIYDMIDRYTRIKGIVAEATKGFEVPQFEIDRSSGSSKARTPSVFVQ